MFLIEYYLLIDAQAHPAALKSSKNALSWGLFSTNRMHVLDSHSFIASRVALIALGRFSESKI